MILSLPFIVHVTSSKGILCSLSWRRLSLLSSKGWFIPSGGASCLGEGKRVPLEHPQHIISWYQSYLEATLDDGAPVGAGTGAGALFGPNSTKKTNDAKPQSSSNDERNVTEFLIKQVHTFQKPNVKMQYFTIIVICLMTCVAVNSFVCQPQQRMEGHRSTALNAVPNPFRAIKNVFRRKPKVTANFPVYGKKVKLTAEKTKELSRKYGRIEDVGDLAYEVIKDLELVDTKWKKFAPKKV